MNNYLSNATFETYPILFLMFIALFSIMMFSFIGYIVLTVVIKIITYKQKEFIFRNFINKTPELFKPWLNMRFGGWLMNMSIPFYPYWTFWLIEKWNKEQVDEWRCVVISCFGKYFILFKVRLILNRITLSILLPFLMIAFFEVVLGM